MVIRLLIIASSLCLIQSQVINLSCDQIKHFVDRHNELRLKVAKGEISGQPGAEEMRSMIWDEELAAKAAKWASNNKLLHNPDRTIESKRFETGENIYWSTSTNDDEVDINAIIDTWFNEHRDYRHGPLTMDQFSKDTKPTGHYTQVVWSDSTHLGCGISKSAENGYINYYAVCNYGPGGNFVSETPYKIGKKGSTLICEKRDNGSCINPYGDHCSSSA